MAALVPVSSIIPIWTAQRDTSARLIASGRIGKRKKNHAMNGNSPTICLQEHQADEVAQELWAYPGVLNLAAVPESRSVAVLSDLAAIDGPDYEFSDEDQRKVIERQIRERRGRQLFREALRQAHGDKCMATGCTVLAVLEAAHIKPYRGGPDNHPQNGLLLRADIHTLFDLDLLGIEPSSLRIELHPSLASEYQALAGARLMIAESATPSRKALQYRYSQFMIRLSQ